MAYTTSGNMCTTYEDGGSTYHQGVKIESITDGSTLGVFAVRTPFTGSDFYDYTYRLYSVRQRGLSDSSFIGEYASGTGAMEFTKTDTPVLANATRYFYQGETTENGDNSTFYGTIFSRRKDAVLDLSIPVYDSSQLGTDDVFNYINSGDDSGAKNYDVLHSSKYDFYISNDGNMISIKWDERIIKDIKMTHYTVEFTSDGGGVWGSFTETNEFSRTWNSIIGGSTAFTVNKMNVTITLYGENDNVIGTLGAYVERKIIFIGNIKTTITVGESNGHRLAALSANEYDDIKTDAEEKSNAESDAHLDDVYYGGFSSLLTTYKVTKDNLHLLGSFIWTNSIFDNIKNLNNSPIENIVSLKYVPSNVPVSQQKNIKLGNVDTEIQGGLCRTITHKKVVGSITIPRYAVGFMNREPYCDVQLYLPLYGMVSLSANDVVGYQITVTFLTDVVAGTFGYCVYTSKGGGQTLIFSCQGSCGIDIPLTSSNRSQIESAVIGTIGSGLVSGALIGKGAVAMESVVGGGASMLGSIANLQFHSQQFNSPSSMIGAMTPSKCYIIIRYPCLLLPSSFAHDYGYACMTTYRLGILSGFTRTCANVDLNGITCTDTEKNEIRALLSNGIYL